MSLETGAPPPIPAPDQPGADQPGPDLSARPRKAPRRKLSPLIPIGVAIVALIVVAAVVSFFWTPFDVLNIDYDHTSAGPGVNGHWLGTDRIGRDIATRLMIGARTALYVGIVAVGIALLIGTPIGILAGMTGRGWSEFIMRSNDIVLAFPALLLAIVLAARYGGSITTAMVAIGVATIPGFVRVIRSGTLRVMNTDYVQAARVAGRSSFSIAVRHVLPNVSGLLIVQASSAYAIAILSEAGLSFLGLGAPLSTPSWGRMLYESQSLLTIAPLTALWPGLAIALAVLGFNLLGDGLRDRLDPTLMRS
jgi:peptide/nickel transport system permease protein